jgi:DNA polymerase-4
VLWGVGARTAEALHRLGIRTVADLEATPHDTLERAVGAAAAAHLAALARGVDPRRVAAADVEKSISADHTTEVDLTDDPAVEQLLLRLSEEVARRVRERGYLARTVGIKIRFADFSTVTRVRTVADPVDGTTAIFQTARDLYRSLELDRPRIRLVGVKCENLQESAAAAQQLSFDDMGPGARSAADGVLDAARQRFGAAVVGYGSLLAQPERHSADQPSADQPSADQPSADQATADQPSADQATADRPT